MKKLTSLVLVFLTSMFSLTSWAADRVAPTSPEPQTLESGNTYYLYNVDSKLFLHRQSTSGVNLSAEGSPVKFISREDKAAGAYTIQFADDYYLHLWYSDKDAANYEDNNSYQVVSGSSSAYRIQKSTNASGYNASHYFGHDTNSSDASSLRSDLTSGNIIWQLFDEAGAESVLRYNAKKALYDALVTAEVNYAWAIADFEAIYENESSTTAELNAAATALNMRISMSDGYKAPWWNERPILFYTADGNFGQDPYNTWALPNRTQDINGNTIYYSSGEYFDTWFNSSTGSRTLSATVNVAEPATFVYSTGGTSDYDSKIQVYVDGVLVRTLVGPQINTYPSDQTYTRFFEMLQPGTHTIKWVASTTNSYGQSFSIRYAGVVNSPLITVSLLEPGSLGTEVLYNTDHIKNVRRLKVIGKMNDDDWAKVKMMSGLLDLDLNEAEFTEVPEGQFRVTSSDTVMQFLHRLVLPEGVTKINKEAFYYSFIDTLALPSTLRNIREHAFEFSHIQEIDMPDDCTEIYGDETNNYYSVFGSMRWLRKLKCAKNWTVIPQWTFASCYFLEEVTLPEKLEAIGNNAFEYDRYMTINFPEGLKRINDGAFYCCYNTNFGAFPEGLEKIGSNAFRECHTIVDLVVPQNVSSLGSYAFQYCSNLKKAELGVRQYALSNNLFYDCNKLDTLRLNSPTVATVTSSSGNYPVQAGRLKDVDLIVPSFLVNAYKLDKYWYNFKSIEPFDYSSIDFIPLNGNLTLNHERFGGQPSIWMEMSTYLKINGDAEQKFQDFSVANDYPNNRYSQVLSNCNNLIGYGDNVVRYHTAAKKWYFVSLPFDLLVSSIYNHHDAQYAIRYYDGSGRAANGKSGNWKNYAPTDIIPAGTGFIFQTNIDVWSYFTAVDNENKFINTIGVSEFNKTLAVNASETTSNKGWNLVGNPYQCYYNNHCLNFTAPITVWNGSTYVAYSLTDDDYAIRPNEAFFVQCPNEEYTTIGFPLQGRQLTSVIESQNAVKEWAPQAKTRQVVNITVAGGETEDMTRVVLNEEASMAYETSCDASKFMSMDSSVPQIYTLDAEGTQYAINERPFAEGFVSLGFYAGTEGSYTISSSRCDAEKVFITDNLTGTTTDITDGAYCFTAKAGTDNTRFTLSFVASDATAIKEIDKDAIVGKVDVYSVEGKFLGNDASRLGAGIYVVRQGKKTSKVIVR